MGPKKPPIKGLNAEVMRRLDWMLAMLHKGEAIASDMRLALPTADNPNKMCASIILLLPALPPDPDSVHAVLQKDMLLRLRALLATVATGDGKERVCRHCAAPRGVHPNVWTTHEFEEMPDPKAEEARDLLRDLAVPIAEALEG